MISFCSLTVNALADLFTESLRGAPPRVELFNGLFEDALPFAEIFGDMLAVFVPLIFGRKEPPLLIGEDDKRCEEDICAF